MATEIILPRVDMDMESGKITRWFVAEGGEVVKGKPLFEIETDKAAMEIEAPANGTLRGVSKELGEVLPVGAVVGWVCAPGEVLEVAASAAPAAPAAPAAEAAPEAPPTAAEPSGPAAADGGVRASPKARRNAREQGVDLAAVAGSGPQGRIQAKDISGRAPAAVSSPSQARLHGEWLARGAGAPLVFIHGFGADLSGWRPLNGYLAAGRGHFAFDLPGHGQSALEGAATMDAWVEAVEATLETEGITSAHWVAHSLGGVIAASYAAAKPAHVRSLTLISSAGLGPEFNGAFARGFLGARSVASLAPWMRELAVDEAALGGAMVKATLARRAERPLVETQGMIAASFFPDGTQALSIRAALERYPGPTRIVFGLEDRIIPVGQTRALPGGIALHLLPGVGHMPHFEARAEVARIVEDNAAAGDRRAD